MLDYNTVSKNSTHTHKIYIGLFVLNVL